MALPINIDELLNGRTVEWERIEFRKGWNPERTLKTICAFANDFNNWGGGYIILGIEESEGTPVLPPIGLDIHQLDKIQQELNRFCRRITPNYFPLVEPVNFQGKNILVLWCPGGSHRPYKAPDSLGQNPGYIYFIRRYSSTVRPTREEEHELLTMANRIPFDDQLNHHANIKDFDLTAIKLFLNEVKSDLEEQIPKLSMNELARRMNIVEGPDENLLPKNVGLLFFAKNIQQFFPYVKIEIVTFEDDSGINYTEKIFTGQLHHQLRGALAYFKDTVIKEKVNKISGRAEADRFFNYPYDAIEEAVCNAVYHRGYDNNSTIEIRIYPLHVDILSYPGPLPPLDKEKLKNNQFDVRMYRNRRIGEFLKELHLTEGRATGIPTILKALQKNGSPKASFETDDERSYFKTSFKIHPGFNTPQTDFINANKIADDIAEPFDSKQAPSWHQVGIKLVLEQKEVLKILEVCQIPQPITELMLLFNWKDRTKFRKKYLNKLLDLELIVMTVPEKPNSSKQKYKTTQKGLQYLTSMKINP